MKNDEVTLTVVHVARSGIVAELKLNKNADPYDPVTRVHAAAVVTQALIDKDLLESPPREFMAEASFHERRGDGQRSTSAMHGKVNGGVMVVATTGGKYVPLSFVRALLLVSSRFKVSSRFSKAYTQGRKRAGPWIWKRP
jgi:hypothetical protein